MNSKKFSWPGFKALFGFVKRQSAAHMVILGIAVTGLSVYFTRSVIQRDETRRFQMANHHVETMVQAHVDRLVNILRHSRAFLGTTERMSRQDFRLFFQNVDIRRSYPGLEGVAYVENLTTADLVSHEREVREDGFKNYRVWPRRPRANFAFPVKFIEPFDGRNEQALGFNMRTEPILRAAIERARDTGQPVLSARTNALLQESEHDAEPGFLLFLPVYRRGLETNSPEKRRLALLGVVSAPIRAHDFFADMYRSTEVYSEGLAFEAYDGPKARPENLLFIDPNLTIDPEASDHKALSHVHVNGQEWTLRVFSTPEFGSRSDRYAPFAVLLLGLLVTALMYWVVFVTRRQAVFQESLAHDLSIAVKERDRSLAQQEQMLRVAQVVSAELDVEKVAQVIIDAAYALSKARLGAFFYSVTDEKHESSILHSLAGISPEEFHRLPMPQNTDIFRPTFMDNDQNAPFLRLPESHLPMRSYLAVSVVSRAGEILGRIILGHEDAGVFSERDETMVMGLAAQAAIAIDNARLFQKNREAIETRDEFLSICSHELRTPLTSLKLQNQLVQRSLKQEVPAFDKTRFSKLIYQSAAQIDRLVRLVEEILDISRIRSGNLSINPERVDLAALASETLERFAAQLSALNSPVELHAPQELTGIWDRLRLEQVFINLLTNAMKYGQGGPILIDLSYKGDTAVLAVQDQGMGIAKEHQVRIFERFERAVSKSEISGLGLGLYIVKQIVDLHGGTVRVESALGKGSRFVVELPMHFLKLKKTNAPLIHSSTA